MQRLLIDTNIFINYQHQKSNMLNQLNELSVQEKVDLYICGMVIYEFFFGVSQTKKNFELAKELFALCNFLPDSFELMIRASYLSRKYNLTVGDAIIAATCLENDCQLVTLNEKHFKMIPKLKIWHPLI